MSVGPTELLLIGLVALLLFGGSRIGDLGKGLGEGIRNFKKGLAGDDAPGPAKKEQKSGADEAGPEAKKERKEPKSE